MINKDESDKKHGDDKRRKNTKVHYKKDGKGDAQILSWIVWEGETR